jgi:hypothetical protein
MRRNAKRWAPAPLELNPNKRTLAAPRGRQPIGAGGEADRFVELAREGGLIRITAFERQFAQGSVRVPEPVAGPVDAQPGEILAGGEPEYCPDSLIELERRKAGSRRKIGNAQGLIEMIIDIGERR